ncbi:MAG: NfeD family protein [Paracoccaceae bacterium]
MEPSIFDVIAGISPWWWVAFAVGLGVVEMATMSFFLIWLGVAALVMAVILAFFPGMSGELRVALFAVLAIAITYIGRHFFMRLENGSVTTINRRSSQLIGRRAKVLEYEGGEGAVEIDGIRWKAHWEAPPEKDRPDYVTVVKADGMLLTVRAERG